MVFMRQYNTISKPTRNFIFLNQLFKFLFRPPLCNHIHHLQKLGGQKGIEPSSPGPQPGALPLSYYPHNGRKCLTIIFAIRFHLLVPQQLVLTRRFNGFPGAECRIRTYGGACQPLSRFPSERHKPLGQLRILARTVGFEPTHESPRLAVFETALFTA